MKEIPLTFGKVAIVNDSDFEVLSKHKWRAMQWGATWYAVRSMKRVGTERRLELIHRSILKTPVGFLTDHINADGLDNRRSNLRIATRSQNQANRRRLQSNNKSGVKGVSLHRGKWRAQIKVMGRKIDLGSFIELDDAARAYLTAANLHFGEFACAALKEGK